MKKLVLIAIFFAAVVAKAQTFDAGGNGPAVAMAAPDKFTYLGKPVANYGLGWYSEAVNIPPYMYMSGFAGIKFFTWTEARMMIDGNGNVGIGTISPLSKLHVNGGAVVVGTNSVTTNADGHVSIGNIMEDSSPTQADWVPNSTLLLNAKDYSSIAFHDSGLRVDFIRAGNGTIQLGYDGGWGNANIGLPKGIWNAQGNVGIGTANPQDKLTVAGNIGAREIKVSTNAGADFVFEPGYKLTDLTELEKFLKTNKHLPEIPTAKQMVDSGVNLGELNIKLLQKVEELTLHLIDKDKELKNEASLIKNQQVQINELKKGYLELKQYLLEKQKAKK